MRAPAAAGIAVLMATLAPAPAPAQALSPAYDTLVERYLAVGR